MKSTVNKKIQLAYQTLENQLVDRKYGLVQSLQASFPHPGEPPIYTARARMFDQAHDLGMRRFQVGGGGTGLDLSHATLSALCESIERYCLHAHSVDVLTDSYANVSQRFNALSPEECPLFHPEQYPAVGFHPFTPETKIAWSWGIALPQGEPILIPTEFVYLRYPASAEGQGLVMTISTGAACGSSAADAVVRGIYEIVERDAMMIMWLNRHPCPRLIVDPQSRLGRFMQRHFRSPNLSPHIFWTTNDLQIPACMAVLVEGAPADRRVFVGLAANLNPEQAAMNALLEAVEVRSGVFETEEAQQPVTMPSHITSIHKHAIYYAQQDRTHLLDFLLSTPHTIELASLPDQSSGAPQADLQTCLERCSQVGQPVFAADLTKEDIRPTGLRVVRVIMPKMQRLTADHNKPFLGNSRLFTVPVQLGWRDRPLSREQINQAPHPFI